MHLKYVTIENQRFVGVRVELQSLGRFHLDQHKHLNQLQNEVYPSLAGELLMSSQQLLLSITLYTRLEVGQVGPEEEVRGPEEPFRFQVGQLCSLHPDKKVVKQ